MNGGLDETDREFLISFENGSPDWEKCCTGDLSQYPLIRWKLQNIFSLNEKNPKKHEEGLDKLLKHFGRV